MIGPSSSHTHAVIWRYSPYQPPRVSCQFYFIVSRLVDKICLDYFLFAIVTTVFPSAFFEKTNCTFLSLTGSSFDLPPRSNNTIKTWTNACSLKGFWNPCVCQHGEAKEFLSNALSHVFHFVCVCVCVVDSHTCTLGYLIILYVSSVQTGEGFCILQNLMWTHTWPTYTLPNNMSTAFLLKLIFL